MPNSLYLCVLDYCAICVIKEHFLIRMLSPLNHNFIHLVSSPNAIIDLCEYELRGRPTFSWKISQKQRMKIRRLVYRIESCMLCNNCEKSIVNMTPAEMKHLKLNTMNQKRNLSIFSWNMRNMIVKPDVIMLKHMIQPFWNLMKPIIGRTLFWKRGNPTGT